MTAPPQGGSSGGAASAIAIRLVNAKTLSDPTVATPPPVEPPRATNPSPASVELAASRPASAASHGPDVHSEPVQLAAGTASAVGAVTAAPADAELGLDYQRRLLAHIEPYKRYPEAASDAQPRGTVQLVFQIDRGGRVLGIWISHSSGFAILDTAAIDTVRRAAPLPAIPAGLPDSMAVQLPVEFSGPG